jgi:hypothetical protein
MGLYKLKPAVDPNLELMMAGENSTHFLKGADYFAEEKKMKTPEL